MMRILGAFFRRCMNPLSYARYLGVQVGEGCRIYTKNWGSEPFLISIGDRVTVTSSVIFLTHDGSTWLIRNSNGIRYQKYKKIVVGNDVFLGVNTIIMPGVLIGSNVVIGAGSVVTKSIPDNSVAVGNPARVIQTFEQYCNKVITNEINDSDLDCNLSFEDKVNQAILLAEAKQSDNAS